MAIRTIFTKGPLTGLSALLLTLLALVFMLLDANMPRFHRIREALSIVVYPLQYAVDTPISAVRRLSHGLVQYQELLTSNEEMRAENLLLKAKLHQALLLKQENAQLKELLQSSSQLPDQVKAAEIMAVSLKPSLNQVVLNVGSHAGAYLGQPVVDAYGVFGQIVAMSPLVSKVLLLTDGLSAIPVEDARNAMRGIVVGNGHGGLSLINMPMTVDVQPGDLLVASGLGQRYPEGYPVGTVSQVQHIVGQKFASITVKPAAHFLRSRQVLLVWPSSRQLASHAKTILTKPLLPAKGAAS